MPYTLELPRGARTTARAFTVTAYTAMALTGVIGATWALPQASTPEFVLAIISGTVTAAAAGLCALAHAFHRWRLEMRTVWVVGLGLQGYMLSSGLFHPWYPGGAIFTLMVLIVLCGLGVRQVSLIIFSHKVTNGARRRIWAVSRHGS